MTSINPPNTDNIFDGVKGIEWRTKPLPTGLHYCYETKNGGGAGKVIGEFTVYEVKRYENASFVPETEIDLGCVPKEFLIAYSKGKPLYANYIAKPRRYEQPKEIWEFCHPCDRDPQCDCNYCKRHGGSKPILRAPQSWCYVEEVPR